LVKYEGNCRELLQYMDRLPQPSLIHITRYLHGGFDKQYPDHLPPHADFGTPDEFRRLVDAARAGGHLLMPYTNPTWWCDEPKGPTFLTRGDAPLLRNLDGTLSAERYGDNTGFTICHWHPAVRAANRKTLRQFTEDYPVDIIFQDQCGARAFRYDTNAASPTPLAYTEGLLSMVAEDSRTVALSTESGWDQVVPYQVQLCGLSWTIVPTEGGPSWRRLMKYEYPPNTWEVFPLAQYVAHDQVAMLGHDLGQFVTNREVLSWMLALGFSMSYRLQASWLDQPGHRQWLAWLDRVQRSVCARYVGRPLLDFQHQRPTPATLDDDGLMRAQYGDVTIHANLGPQPRRVTGLEVAPLGFVARAPDTLAANLHSIGDLVFDKSGISFVVQVNPHGAEAWIYAEPDSEVAVLLPKRTPRQLELTMAGRTQAAICQDGVVRFRLPLRHPSTPIGSVVSIDAYLWHVTLVASDN
jgi:hypothetical protein